MNRLNAQAVKELFAECIADDVTQATLVKGIINNFAMDPQKIEQNKQAINDMLAELPEGFHVETGGGQSFLNMCGLRDSNRQWGEHQDMEKLYVLGKAADLATFPLPRDFWPSLPGGMPYVTVWPEIPAEEEV